MFELTVRWSSQQGDVAAELFQDEFAKQTSKGYIAKTEKQWLHMSHPIASVPKKAPNEHKLRIVIDMSAPGLNRAVSGCAQSAVACSVLF